MINVKNCHDCGAKPGELHKEGCDSPYCTICGIQLLQCGHYPAGNSIHTGIESQELKIIADALGLYCRWDNGWKECFKDDEGSRYNLNKASIIYQKTLERVRNNKDELK